METKQGNIVNSQNPEERDFLVLKSYIDVQDENNIWRIARIVSMDEKHITVNFEGLLTNGSQVIYITR